jgi:8-oxo-dGTP pyrophosphatase MutT (NUDIX family)
MRPISDPIPQAAALALCGGRICLVTSSSGKRWVIPKGHCEPGHTPAETALQEAWEEAGLHGTVRRQPLGWYAYNKAGHLYRVTVYLMDVTEVAEKWPERGHRRRRWCSPSKILDRLNDPGLCELLRQSLPVILNGSAKKTR